MVVRFLLVVLSLALTVTMPELAFAQKANGTNTEKPQSGTRKQLTMIVFAGIAGAILGLSTLSFYGRPQDKLNNIAGGFAVGIIVGAIYSAYKVTTQPHELSRGAQYWEDEQRLLDHPRFSQTEPPKLGYTLRF